jgi:hypothetical protein
MRERIRHRVGAKIRRAMIVASSRRTLSTETHDVLPGAAARRLN